MNVSATLELKHARELLAKLKSEERLILSNGLRFYEPAGVKHDRFHRGGEFKYRYLRTGNRFGKSECGGAEDIAWLRGEREWMAKDDPDRYKGIPKRSVKGILVVENWDKADEIFTNMNTGTGLGKLWKYIPKDAYIDCERRHGHIDTIYVRSIHGGTSMLKIDTVVSFKQDPMSSESSQWDFAHIDEPIPEPMWKAISRGFMDTGGKAWFTCTPLVELWINDFFLGSRVKMTEHSDPRIDGKKLIITGSSRDNKYLSEENIKDFAMTLKKDEYDTRILGRPSGSGGLVYPQFDHNVHVYTEDDMQKWMKAKGWGDMDDPPRDFTVRLYLDLHSATPDAALFAATGPQDYTFFFHEIFERRLLSFLAEDILKVMEGRFWNTTWIDLLAFKESPVDDTCWADDLANRGIVGMPAPKEKTRGIRETQEYLAKRDTNGKPKCMFSSRLTETLYEFEHYVWDPKKQNVTIDKDDHMMEDLYRAVLTGLDYIDLNEDNPTFVPQIEPKFDLSIPKQNEGVVKKPQTYFDELRDYYPEEMKGLSWE